MVENCPLLPFFAKTLILDLHQQERLDQTGDTSIDVVCTVYPHTNNIITLLNASVCEWFKVA
jgi:hypothetical protein